MIKDIIREEMNKAKKEKPMTLKQVANKLLPLKKSKSLTKVLKT